jgi:ATP synthase protein I
MPSSSTPKPDSTPPRGGNFAKYSGLGIQMLAIIGLGIGPWGTVVLMLLSVFIAMYQVIRSVSSE